MKVLTCPFHGRYWGKPWKEIPVGYLKWVLNNVPTLRGGHPERIKEILKTKR